MIPLTVCLMLTVIALAVLVVRLAITANSATAARERDRAIPPPATQAGAAMLYYTVAQEETRLLERMVIADQAVPLFPDERDREIARSLITTFYYGQPPQVTPPPQAKIVVAPDQEGLAIVRQAAQLKRILEPMPKVRDYHVWPRDDS